MTDLLSYAPHSYFHPINRQSAWDLFSSDPVSNPVFVYRDYDPDVLHTLRSKIDKKSQKSVDLVLAGIALRKHPSERTLEAFRLLNQEFYIVPQLQDVYGILARSLRKKTSQTEDLADYVMARIPNIALDAELYRPKQSTIDTLRRYIRKYIDLANFQEDMSLVAMFEIALRKTKLDEQGWFISVEEGASHARTIHRTKRIVVGMQYTPRTRLAKLQIVLHEVYGHALRGHQDSIMESEGFASMLEQLVLDNYTTRRSYRYIAAALGWGVVAPAMNFREVYEILWRIMAIGRYYDEDDAKKHAFSECVRVFRGGNPAVPGAVFLKDALYFVANMNIWKAFDKQQPSYEDFCLMIEGKKRVLS